MSYAALLLGILATLVLLLGGGSVFLAFSAALIAIGALAYLMTRAEAARHRLEELQRLRDAYTQLDQQAKLIIRTDLELHRTQEELDRRLTSLMSLHQIGRQLQVSLHPEEVYARLDATVVTQFGFANGLIGLCPSFEAIEWRALIGVQASAAEMVRTHLIQSGLLKRILTDPAPRTIAASTTDADPAQRKLLDLLGIPAAVVAGIIPHAGPTGCLFLGRVSGDVAPSHLDEELVAILTNQLAFAIENCALYEETWDAQRTLEQKVHERTRELAGANTALLRLNQAKSDFVSAVSHELRTPLAAIKGYAALLGSGQFGPLAIPQTERIAKIERHADFLTQLINNLLDIARIESGRVVMERRPIPIEQLLTSVQDMVHPQLEAKGIRYTVDRDGVTELQGDAQHLPRVFVNLLSNAVKYTPEGGSIRLTLQREGRRVIAAVEDTGCGIAPEDLPKLFQEFYRTSDPVNQSVPGTGLGLALAKRIVEAHGGQTRVRSEKGKGSTFIVSLPEG